VACEGRWRFSFQSAKYWKVLEKKTGIITTPVSELKDVLCKISNSNMKIRNLINRYHSAE
jgi:hypothetical protein